MQIKPIEWKYTGFLIVFMIFIQIVISTLFSFALWKWSFSWGDVRYVCGEIIIAILVTASWNLFVKIKGDK